MRMFNSQSSPKQQDMLLQMDAYKSTGPHGIPLRILKMLLMSSKNLSMIFEQSWESRGFPAGKCPSLQQQGGPWQPQACQSHFSAWPHQEEMVLGSTEKHLEDNAGINHSQHSFMKENSCLLNLISFCDKVDG